MKSISEAARDIPIVHGCDLCVIGGSCTGVFAAVRAARLGRSVVLLEKTNAFGGVATNGLVNIWHSHLDTEFKQQIIGGLTLEVTDRLAQRNAVEVNPDNPHSGFHFNAEELKIELDQLVRENGITPMLHTSFCAPVVENGMVKAVLIENKDGRSAIQAAMYVDASGDGDLFAAGGIPYSVDKHLQPPTTCARIRNFNVPDLNFRELYDAHHAEFGLERDSGWDTGIPGLPGIQMFAQTHVFDVDCSRADQLTKAEIEGRRQVRAVMDMIRKYGPQKDDIALAALPAYIGIRETRRFEAEYCLTEEDVLSGRSFEDTIAQGSYRVDVHHPDGGGFLFKYLDGTTEDVRAEGRTSGRWRDPIDEDPTFYQIPYRTMVHTGLKNAIMAGRMIAADKGAFGAIRVMVNLNQTGEAAGTAAHLALEHGCEVREVDGAELRDTLRSGGSILL
ncbi:FAD-dependent oxidoreductase [Planctomycetota bacterium]